MNEHLSAELYGSAVIGGDQQGFRRRGSTAWHLWRVALTLALREPVRLLLVDFEKAFDSVVHKALAQLMTTVGVHATVVELVADLYTDVKVFPVVHGQTRRSFSLMRSVRQGCPLSPLLFNLYLEPILRIIRSLRNPQGTPFLCAGLCGRCRG